ncbi:MAG: ribosome biogenesis GTPase Der [Anaerolineae bacterium]|nr:ribosome biogenesis GTPase Der [Anaerolineae bacterium]
MTKPLVALVGRPNVGKSTLFNRLVEERKAITEDIPGTTRDRIYADTEWNGILFTVIDTGGLILDDTDDMISQVRHQAYVAIEEADVLVFMCDVLDGLTTEDQSISDILRRTDKPIILAVNKADNPARRLDAFEFYALGTGDPYAISALHGTGTGDLLDVIVSSFKQEVRENSEEIEATRIAIVGRTNVGKSSLLNALLRKERQIVSPVPGTTRDAIDTMILWKGSPLVLIDTAGIRRRGRIAPGVEKYSVLRALKAINRADVVLLIIDATEGVTAQDAHIAGYILEENKSVVVVNNKWDLIEKDSYTMLAHTAKIREALKFMSYVPVLFISALTRQRVDQTLNVALRVHQQGLVRIPTGELNRIVQNAVARHSPPSKWGKRLRIYYATQPKVSPPTILFFVNDERLVHFSYRRYLENQIRSRYPFEGTPLRLSFRDRRKE